MAYGNFIAAVSFAEVELLGQDSMKLLHPTKIELVSHLIASWVQVQPLGRLLREALDGGEKLADGLWHPLRFPTVHPPAEVVRLLAAIREADRAATAGHSTKEGGWFGIEIDRLCALFSHAADHGEAVVSVLGLPADAERSAKIRIPFDIESTS
jgi:hypothetical protein